MLDGELCPEKMPTERTASKNDRNEDAARRGGQREKDAKVLEISNPGVPRSL